MFFVGWWGGGVVFLLLEALYHMFERYYIKYWWLKKFTVFFLILWCMLFVMGLNVAWSILVNRLVFCYKIYATIHVNKRFYRFNSKGCSICLMKVCGFVSILIDSILSILSILLSFFWNILEDDITISWYQFWDFNLISKYKS